MQSQPENAVGLDVGGTRIRAARITAQGEMQGRLIEPVVPDRVGFVAQVLRLIQATRNPATCAVGIGIPGRVSGDTGVVQSAGYLDIGDLDLPTYVGAKTGFKCQVQNDATMALIAEARGQAGLIAMITVGTGIGGALVRDGVPFSGAGFAGQFGHMVVAAEGPQCNCGRTGCIETFSSGTALGALIAAAGLPARTTAADVLAAADSGDANAKAILTTWAAPMERALQTLTAIVDPERIVLGGGLGADMVRALAMIGAQSSWFQRPVAPARLGDDAGVIGAGLAGFAAADPA